MAVLTHGGDGGGGGYSPEVSPPQPGLHAGGAGGGDGSGPGSARGPRAALAALGAPAASPGSGSGRGRALWHEQGGPLHPRSSPARPSPASAAPLGPPARQSRSPEVALSGHCSPPQERSEKQTAGRAASFAVRHSCQRPPIPGSCWASAPPPLTLPANNREGVGSSRPSSARSQHPHSRPPANHDEPIPPTLTGCQWAKSGRFPRAV